MTLDDINIWAEELLYLMENEARDTDDRWQKRTRMLMSKAFRRRLTIKEWVLTNKPAALPFLVELNDYMVDYCKYFETGYVSVHTIDELPSLIKDRLKFILERIDSLYVDRRF